MTKTILTAALSLLLISCTNEPDSILFSGAEKQIQQKENDTPIDYELNVPYEFPIENEKETVYLVISLNCKKYLAGGTQYDFDGVGMSENGMLYVVRSRWTIVVDPVTNKPRHKQLISATPVNLPIAGLPC